MTRRMAGHSEGRYRVPVSTTLKVKLQGRAPWLQNHRLSIDEMSQPLSYLTNAYRWAAHALITETNEESRISGRMRKDAARLDLELSSVTPDCVDLTFHCVSRTLLNENSRILESDITERAVSRVLDALDREQRGEQCNHYVQRYLASLPTDVERQVYSGYVDGRLLREVVVDTRPQASVLPTHGPRVQRIAGRLAEVGLEAGRSFIKLRPEGGKPVRIDANIAHVETALANRERELCATLLVRQDSARLLRLDVGIHPPHLEDAEITSAIFTKWAELLQVLA